jgi:hypothetical protein
MKVSTQFTQRLVVLVQPLVHVVNVRAHRTDRDEQITACVAVGDLGENCNLLSEGPPTSSEAPPSDLADRRSRLIYATTGCGREVFI